MPYIPKKSFLRWQPSENTTLLLLSIAVGLLTGIGVLIFRAGIEVFHTLFVEQLGNSLLGTALVQVGLPPALSSIGVLGLAGLLVGLIMNRFVGHEKYHGVAGIMEAVALSGGKLPYWRIPFKALSAMISIGAGASVGPEDPSVQIGSNVGSWLGQKLHLSEERVSLLVSAGAASAVASAFNAPIAGVFFALEVILGQFTTKAFGVVVLSAVISSGLTRAVKGENPIFANLQPFVLGTPAQLVLYGVLGIGLGIFSSLGLRYFFWQSGVMHRIKLSTPLKTMLTGVLVGIVAVFFPQIMGAGETFMHDVLIGHAELGLGILIGLVLVKLAMTAISQGGGFVGGVFAPSLFMGIVFGQAYGLLVNAIFPTAMAGSPQAYAIAGMAGMLAGFVRAPITAILIVFEITRDYPLILPIMLTTVVCTVIVEKLGPAGIYTLNLMRNGVYLQQGRDIDVTQSMTVREAMQSPAPTIAHSASLVELRDAYRQFHTRAMCVVNDENQLIGIVTLGDLQKIFENALEDPTIQPHLFCVADICSRNIITAYPDDVLWTAIRNMGAHDIGRVPVVTEGKQALVGILRRQDIMNAYNVAIQRKLHDQHTTEQIRLNTLTGAHLLEYHIHKQCLLQGKSICDVALPPESLIASIQRKGKLIVPHGSTVLLPDDLLTIVADKDSEMILDTLFMVPNHPQDRQK